MDNSEKQRPEKVDYIAKIRRAIEMAPQQIQEEMDRVRNPWSESFVTSATIVIGNAFMLLSHEDIPNYQAKSLEESIERLMEDIEKMREDLRSGKEIDETRKDELLRSLDILNSF